jgi:RNA polymerase sigma factor (sigma-70 family)
MNVLATFAVLDDQCETSVGLTAAIPAGTASEAPPAPVVTAEELLTDSFVRNVVRRKVRQLLRRKGFQSHDREDLEQEFFTRLLARLPKFNEARGHFRSFVATVVERHTATIDAKRRRKMRDPNRSVSLEALQARQARSREGTKVELSEQAHALRLPGRRPDEQSTREVALDVAAAAATLSTEEQELCDALSYYSVAELAEREQVSATTIYNRARRLRKHFRRLSPRQKT